MTEHHPINTEGVIKNLEIRWGLTIVSFIPEKAQRKLISLQHEVASILSKDKEPVRTSRHYISYYRPEQFHCTHFTLTRSDPGGAVSKKSLFKSAFNESDLFGLLKSIATVLPPFQIELNRISLGKDGLGIILTGQCTDIVSIQTRTAMLEQLKHSLPEMMNISSRSWDQDSSRFHEVHCAIGYIKRVLPIDTEIFQQEVQSIKFEPIVFLLDTITLVHHRFRSLMFPQEGIVHFTLGNEKVMQPAEFIRALNLAD
ncbi:MAG: hypothetical protein DYG98_10500 [Haliscomenobacteraceae bacterium CHB4]|nr:hypothetical protein [Haliscomenobacteraceae bacterium CHB4]